MKYFVKGGLLFSAGFLIGAAATYYYRKKKFDDNLDSAVKQIKKDMEEEYKKNVVPDRDAFVKAKELAKASENKPSITNYTKMYSGESVEVDATSYDKHEEPVRLISEAQLYEGDGIKYAGETLILYADGVLTNTENEPVKKVQEIIGEEFLVKFYGSEEEDRIFVRNDDSLVDYEIVKSSETYSSTIEEASEEEE